MNQGALTCSVVLLFQGENPGQIRPQFLHLLVDVRPKHDTARCAQQWVGCGRHQDLYESLERLEWSAAREGDLVFVGETHKLVMADSCPFWSVGWTCDVEDPHQGCPTRLERLLAHK